MPSHELFMRIINDGPYIKSYKHGEHIRNLK